ncbi:MAG: hypothetical protein WCF08_07215, partial [Anaerolineaceae bacterium]
MDFPENLVSCIGLSISATSVILYLTHYLPFKITPILLVVLYSACAVSSIIAILHRKIKIRWSLDTPITLLLFTVVLFLRFYQAKDLVLPAWVDSVHHVLITKVILEKGMVPSTLEPYLAVPFSYYFGFHGLAAAFSAISGLPPEKAVLILGQILNACMPLAIYRLGRTIWTDRTRPVIAALFVAFVSQMPAYYVTWGRYTLLTGMIMLAIAMAEMTDVHQKPGRYRAALLCLIVFGLTLSHYFSALLFILFTVLYLLNSYFKAGRHLTSMDLKAPLVISIAFLLLAPWLIRAYHLTGYSLDLEINFQTINGGWQSIQAYAQYLFKLACPFRNYIFLSIGILGIIPTVLNRQSRILAIWSIIILITSLPLGFKLPNIRPDHMNIILFFPLSLCAANLLVFSRDKISKYLPKKIIVAYIFSLPLIGFCIWGIIETRSIINPETV